MSDLTFRNYIDVEKFSSKQHKIFTCLLILGILLILGKYITPIEHLVAMYVELAESEANSVAGSALITFGAVRLINAAISFAQEISFSVGVFGGANLSPFKVLEPIDDSIERFSQILFYMLIAFKMMAVFFTPLLVLGDFALLVGLPGALAKKYIIPLQHINWPKKLITFGLFAYIFPLSFLLALQLGNLVIEDRIQREYKVFSGIIDDADLEKINEVSEEQPLTEQKVGVDSSQTETKGQPSETKWWWPFSSDNENSDGEEKNVSDIKDESSWWEFWKDNENDPGMFETFSSIWDTTLNVWDHVAQATKIVGTLVLNSGTIIDASLTLLALYLIKLILIPALFLYFSIKLLRSLMSRENKFLDYSMEKMNPFRKKDESKG